MALQMLEDDVLLQRMLLTELGRQEQTLFKQVSALDCGLALLAFLNDNANTLSSVDSIAFRVSRPQDAVAKSLHALLKMGLVRRLDVGPTMWGLTADAEQRRLVQNLIRWQTRWQARLNKLENVIRGVTQCGVTQCDALVSKVCENDRDCPRCSFFLLNAVAHLQAD